VICHIARHDLTGRRVRVMLSAIGRD
jgi:hypothetical protein